MSSLDNVYLKKESDNPNAVYVYLKDLNKDDIILLKEIDTTSDEINVISSKKDSFNDEYVSIKNLINEDNYIGETGYYKDMFEIEKYLYSTFVVMYRSDDYELLYDTFRDKYFVNVCFYSKDSFIPINVVKDNEQKVYKL